MTTNLRMDQLVPTSQMIGEDSDETHQLQDLLREARAYIGGFSWCHSVEAEYFGLGVGGVVAVFLFDVNASPGVDRRLWVITGDIPSAYLVPDSSPTPAAALATYCDMMDDWIGAVRAKGDLSEVFPVSASPTVENANLLEKKIKFLRDEVIPAFE